jgi:2,3-bisphosphoglycerate-dependent phosphoglycerate mutase
MTFVVISPLMKRTVVCIIFLLSILTVAGATFAQDKIIVLVRHAEKADATSQDPELSAEGKERAQRLIKRAGKYRPKEFYSTDFKRTRDTLAPLAAKRNIKIQTYDPRKAKELAESILKSPNKRIIVSGHSNTIPGLANLIARKEVFKNLDDSEYSLLWVIRIKKGKLQRVELFEY